MVAQIGNEHAGVRARDDGRGLALDLTVSEVVLCEGRAGAGWRRFAGVAVDDPEFHEVIALLRAEAESEFGAGRPVLIWLPAEQVLRLSVRLDGDDAGARLAAAFRHASRATGHAADELALALGPDGPEGEATLLVTHAATWHEARDYAAQWGFVPGPVSTRHHAEEFGPEGPDFQIAAAAQAAGEEAARDGSRRLAWLAVGLAAVFASALAGPAVASAPAAAPVPQARGIPAAAAPASSGPAVRLPPARPAGRGEASSPSPQPALPASPSGTAAMPGGLATPLPLRRPDRAAAPREDAPQAVASATMVAPAPVALPQILPRARPAGLSPGLRLDRVALIGVLDLDTGREALLRMPDGDFVTVGAGEVIEGWKVAVIGPDSMQVRRGGETRTLLLVSR